MKLKLWKITAMVTLPLAAVITVPMVLTSCSNTKPTPPKEEPVITPDYSPSDAIKAEFSKTQFDLVVNGFTKTMTTMAATNITVKLNGDVLELTFQLQTLISLQKIKLTPVASGDNANKFEIVAIMNGITAPAEYKTLDEIKGLLIPYYNAGIEEIAPVTQYSPSEAVQAKFSKSQFDQVVQGFIKMQQPLGVKQISVSLKGDVFEASGRSVTDASGTEAMTLNTMRTTLTPIASGPDAGKFLQVAFIEEKPLGNMFITKTELTSNFKQMFDAGASTQLATI